MKMQKRQSCERASILVAVTVVAAILGVVVIILSQTTTDTTVNIAGYKLKTDNALVAGMFILAAGLLGGVVAFIKRKSKDVPPAITAINSQVIVGSAGAQQTHSNAPQPVATSTATPVSGTPDEQKVKKKAVVYVYR